MQLNEIFHQVATDKESEGLRDLSARTGLSEDQLIVIAVNRLLHDALRSGNEVDRPSQDLVDDIRVELEFERHGRQVGKITYLNASEDFIQRAEARIAAGIPLPHEDDDSLERTLLFRFLTEEQQAQVKATSDPMEKRHLIAAMLNNQPTDYPTVEDLADWEGRGLIERRPEEKSRQLADFFKKHGVED